MMRIYLICSVRDASDEQLAFTKKYAEDLRSNGHTVFYPPEDAQQDDETGWAIVTAEREAIEQADRIDVIWDVNSKGSHFDLGMAFALRKPIKRVSIHEPDSDHKSYWKVMGIWEDL
jgi:nucleoside 2-deoxyribosyltransferase